MLPVLVTGVACYPMPVIGAACYPVPVTGVACYPVLVTDVACYLLVTGAPSRADRHSTCIMLSSALILIHCFMTLEGNPMNDVDHTLLFLLNGGSP